MTLNERGIRANIQSTVVLSTERNQFGSKERGSLGYRNLKEHRGRCAIHYWTVEQHSAYLDRRYNNSNKTLKQTKLDREV